MNRTIPFLLLLLIMQSESTFGISDRFADIQMINDYSLSYVWDKANNDWLVSQRTEYTYNSYDKLEMTVNFTISTEEPVSRVKYFYDNDFNLVQYTSEKWNNSKWEYGRKYTIEYDGSGKRESQIVENFIDGNWIYERKQFDYIYSENNLISCTYQYWSGSQWKESLVETYTYDSNNLLIGSISIDPLGNNINRVFYYNNEQNKRTGMFVQQWSISNQKWVDWYRDSYTYNDCGTRTSFIRERNQTDVWVNESKAEYFYKVSDSGFSKNRKVAICHNGHTIYVSQNAVKAHLSHGDCLGECAIEKSERERERKEAEYKKPPFTVYPNPATERITVKFDSDECDDTKIVELTDFYGKKIRTYKIDGNSDLTIPRGNLLDGKYYLSVKGEETYSVIVIFN